MIFRLPKTSYVKLVDYWLLFTLAIPLVEVLLHTMIANYNMKIENEKACKGNFLKHFGHIYKHLYLIFRKTSQNQSLQSGCFES